MTTRIKHTRGFLVFAMAGLIAACAPQEEEPGSSPASSGGDPGNEPAETAAVEPTERGITVEIEGDDSMSYNVTEFSVEAGESVTLVFSNVGTMPKQSMGHNVVVLEMGVDKMDFANAAQRHPSNNYLPPEREDEVIAATGLLGPDESDTITFIAPEEPGEYDYLCTFPGHAAAGMVGVMTVE